jgi:site-specific recombinase XerD
MISTAIDTSIEGFKKHMAVIRSPATADKYARNVQMFVHVLHQSNLTNLETLPPNILVLYTAELRNAGYSPSTINTQIHAAKRYLRWIREQGAGVTQPFNPELPKVQFRMREILEPEHVQRYFDLADQYLDEPVRTAVMLAPCAGLRAHELVKIELENVRRGRIQLGDEVKETLILRVIGKGDKERIVPLLDEGAQVLTNYLAGWRRSCTGHWLFPAGHSPRLAKTALHQRTLSNAMIRIREPMGLDFTPHTMRRTYLTTLWRRGVPAEVLAKIAGHKSVDTLLRHYLALDEKDILNRVHHSAQNTSLILE